jgi:hypothetical protein
MGARTRVGVNLTTSLACAIGTGIPLLAQTTGAITGFVAIRRAR